MHGSCRKLWVIFDCFFCITVDGKNPAPVDSSLSYYLQGLYIPGGAGFLPSTVWLFLIFFQNHHSCCHCHSYHKELDTSHIYCKYILPQEVYSLDTRLHSFANRYMYMHLHTLRSKKMAQIPKGRLVKGPYKPICRDCAIYFSTTVYIYIYMYITYIIAYLLYIIQLYFLSHPPYIYQLKPLGPPLGIPLAEIQTSLWTNGGRQLCNAGWPKTIRFNFRCSRWRCAIGIGMWSLSVLMVCFWCNW